MRSTALWVGIVVALVGGCAHGSTPATRTADEDIAFEDEGDGASRYPASAEVQAAEARLVAGELAEARRLLGAYLEGHPRDPRALLDLGLCLELGDDLPGAEARYREALSVAPDFAEALNNLGLLLRDTERRAEAIPLFQRAISIRPGFGEAHQNLAMTFEEEGRLDEAEAEYRTAARLSPRDPLPRVNLGFLLVRRGRLDDGTVELRRARTLAQGDAALSREIARGLVDAGHADEAVAILEGLVAAEDAPSATLLVELAAAQVAARRFPQAEESARRAVRADDRSAVAHLLLGRLLAARQANDEARGELQRAQALAGDDVAIARAAQDALRNLPPASR